MILGIDPGASGGFAWRNGALPAAMKMPDGEAAVLEALQELTESSDDGQHICYIEKVGGFTGKPQPGARMFTFGRGFGFLLGVLMTLKWEVHLVTPQKWQRAAGLGTKGTRTPAEWKRTLRDEAARLYPEQKVTLATADALLILEYARGQKHGARLVDVLACRHAWEELPDGTKICFECDAKQTK